jgi:hypothetical protein
LCFFGLIFSTALSAPIVSFLFVPFSFLFLYPGFPMFYWTLAVPLAHPIRTCRLLCSQRNHYRCLSERPIPAPAVLSL